MKKKLEMEAYVRKQLAANNFVAVVVPEQRKDDKWLSLKDQHTQDRHQEKTLRLLCDTDPYIVTAFNGAKNVLSVCAIRPPQDSLPLDEKLVPFEPEKVAREAERSVLETKETDRRVVDLLNAGRVKSYEELVAAVGTPEALHRALIRISHLKDKGTELATFSTVVPLDPGRILTKSLRSEKTRVETVEFFGLAKEGRGQLQVLLSPEGSGQTDAELNRSRVRTYIRARLDTRNNARTLKLLQAAQFMNLKVEVAIGEQYDIGARRLVPIVEALRGEDDLVSKIGPLAELIDELA